MNYYNPILTGFYPDPSICKVGNDYYMVNSSFEYLPGIPVSHSKDLVHWEKIGYCITRKSQMEYAGCKASDGLWAPTIRYHKGTFFVVCTRVFNSQKHNFIVTSSNPAGEWSDPVWLEQDGIDPSLFFDEDEKVYLTSNGWGKHHDPLGRTIIQQSQIDIKTGNYIVPPQVISYGSGGRCVEGPHLYKINGIYYLLLAEGGTELGHMVTVFRSDTPWGPFTPGPDNPILTARDEGNPELSGTGHGDLIQDEKGNWWMVFLCYRISTVKYHHLGRETALVPIEWKDGWPVVPNGKCPSAYIHIPQLPDIPENHQEEVFTDNFEKDDLGLEWNFSRTFLKSYKICSQDKKLLLYGDEANLSSRNQSTFIGRRQCHMEMTFRVEITFSPNNENEEAGITVLCSDRAHYDLGIIKRQSKKLVKLHKVIEDMETSTEAEIPEQGSVILAIATDKERYYFKVILQNGQILELGTGMTKLLSTEVIWGFTGVYLGLYATGNGCKSTAPAEYKNCVYIGKTP